MIFRPNIVKHVRFCQVLQLFRVLEGRKIEILRQTTGEIAEDTLNMRLIALRRFQNRQKGGSGLPKELPRLSPKATGDIGGMANRLCPRGGGPEQPHAQLRTSS